MHELGIPKKLRHGIDIDSYTITPVEVYYNGTYLFHSWRILRAVNCGKFSRA